MKPPKAVVERCSDDSVTLSQVIPDFDKVAFFGVTIDKASLLKNVQIYFQESLILTFLGACTLLIDVVQTVTGHKSEAAQDYWGIHGLHIPLAILAFLISFRMFEKRILQYICSKLDLTYVEIGTGYSVIAKFVIIMMCGLYSTMVAGKLSPASIFSPTRYLCGGGVVREENQAEEVVVQATWPLACTVYKGYWKGYSKILGHCALVTVFRLPMEYIIYFYESTASSVSPPPPQIAGEIETKKWNEEKLQMKQDETDEEFEKDEDYYSGGDPAANISRRQSNLQKNA